MRITKLKKRGFASIMLMTLLLPLIWTISSFVTSGSYVEASTKTTLVNNDELLVEATSTTKNNQIYWQINYQHKNVSATNQQRLKIKIDKGDGYLRTENLTNSAMFEDGNLLSESGWILQKQYSYDANTKGGHMSFVTNKSVNRIRAMLQADRKVQTTGDTTSTLTAGMDDEEDSDADPEENTSTTTTDIELTENKNVLSESTVGPYTLVAEEQKPTVKDSSVMGIILNSTKSYLQSALNLFNTTDPQYHDVSYTYVQDDVKGITNEFSVDEGNISNYDYANDEDGNIKSNVAGTDYVSHGGTVGEHEADVKLHKSIAEVADQAGTFDVTLKVLGDQYEPAVPISVMLVLDYSGSMGYDSSVEGESRWIAVQKAAIEMVTSLLESKDVDGNPINEVAVTLFNETQQTVINFNNDAEATIAAINEKKSPAGGTYTIGGMSYAQDLIDKRGSAGNGSKPVMILLSDGAPTLSTKATSYTGTGSNILLNFDKNIPATGEVGNGKAHKLFFETSAEAVAAGQTHYYTGSENIQAYNVSDESSTLAVTDHRLPTASFGQKLKNQGTEIYSIGFANGDEQRNYSVNRVRDGRSEVYTTRSTADQMDQMLTDIASSSSHFYKSSNYAGLVAQLKEIERTMNYSVRQGNLLDNIDLKNYVINPEDFDAKVTRFDIVNGEEVEVELAENTISTEINQETGNIAVKGVSLGRNQGIKLTYRVHIRTQKDDFKADYFTPTNTMKNVRAPEFNNATFQSIATETTALEFPVVSAKAPGTSIDVLKTWVGAVATDSITFTIGQNGEDWGTASLASTDLWFRNVSQAQIGDDPNVVSDLPSYDNEGNNFSYSITGEDTIEGYETDIDYEAYEEGQDDGLWTITNSQIDSGDRLLSLTKEIPPAAVEAGWDNYDFRFKLHFVQNSGYEDGQEISYTVGTNTYTVQLNENNDGTLESDIFTLKPDQNATFNLRDGDVVYIEELLDLEGEDQFEPVWVVLPGTSGEPSNNSPEIDLSESNVELVAFNNYEEAAEIVVNTSLTVRKTVESTVAANLDREYTFELNNSDETSLPFTKYNANGTTAEEGYLVPSDGVHSFTLSHGQYIVIQQVTENYSLTEIDGFGAEVSITGTQDNAPIEPITGNTVESNIGNEGIHDYTFLNDFDDELPPVPPTLEVRNLSVTKRVVNSDTLDLFTMRFAFSDSLNGSYVLKSSIKPDQTIQIIDGQFRYMIAPNETITIIGIPSTTEVTVTEELTAFQQERVELVEVNSNGGAIEENNMITVGMSDHQNIIFTNTYFDNVDQVDPDSPNNPGSVSLPGSSGTSGSGGVINGAGFLPQTGERSQSMLLVAGGLIIVTVIMIAGYMYKRKKNILRK